MVALTALLRRYRLSDREVVDFYQTVVGMPISVGSVVRLCAQASAALAPVYDAFRRWSKRRRRSMSMRRAGGK